jgi:VanZ family protein
MHSPFFRFACGLAALVLALSVFVGAEAVADPQFVGIVSAPWDKIVHFCYFGSIAALLGHSVGRRWLWISLVAVPLVGAFDEWHQSFIIGRDASIFDWFADAAGTLVFLAFYWYYVAETRLRTQD